MKTLDGSLKAFVQTNLNVANRSLEKLSDAGVAVSVVATDYAVVAAVRFQSGLMPSSNAMFLRKCVKVELSASLSC